MIEFWFEFASTYSYPAAMRVERVAAGQGVPVIWKPFLLGPLFREQQGLTDSPFNVVPVKGRYMWRDMARICDAEGLAFRQPAIFPQNGLKAARLTLALPEALRPDFVRSVYQANFAQGQDISSETVLENLLHVLGQDARACFDAAERDDVKTQLKQNTQQAAAYGIFGAPSFLTPDGELFWGNDRLEQAVAWAHSATMTSEQN